MSTFLSPTLSFRVIFISIEVTIFPNKISEGKKIFLSKMRKKIFIFLKIDLLQIFYIFQKSHFGLIDELVQKIHNK